MTWQSGNHDRQHRRARVILDEFGIPIVSGREFSDVDATSSQPVVIVNEKLVRDFWPGDNPLGKRLQVPQGWHWWLWVC